MSSPEFPEQQMFHILRNGEQEAIGPYSQTELVSLLNSEQITATDFVYYSELDGWKPLGQIFDIQKEVPDFGEQGQDPRVVTECINFINSRAEPGEQVHYVAVQQLPALSLTAAVRLTSPKSIILTNRRFCILNPRLMGSIEFEEYPLEKISGGVKKLKSGKDSGVFNIVLKNSEWVTLDKLPVEQLNRLEYFASVILSEAQS
ncbi:MAG: GYF domain-containing protein [Verrucomicrobiales bacterium]|nr:GYF domain-containing protein [Verrucomicrobiales bacterium]